MSLRFRIHAALIANYHKTGRIGAALYLGQEEVRELDAMNHEQVSAADLSARSKGGRRRFADLPVFVVDAESYIGVSV